MSRSAPEKTRGLGVVQLIDPVSPGDLTAIGGSTRRGYTGHEHLDNLGLVNMNGRVQDPRLGRFLSADPLIQAPDYSQSLNRYSYVWNNPLSLTDPSGFSTVDGATPCGVNSIAYNFGAMDVCVSFDYSGGAISDTLPWHNGGSGRVTVPIYVQLAPAMPSQETEKNLMSVAADAAVSRGLARPNSTVGRTFTLADTLTSVTGYKYLRNEEPSALTDLRTSHPALRQLEDELWQASLPGSLGLFLQKMGFPKWSGAREHSALVFQSEGNSNLLTFRQYAASPDAPNVINGDLTPPAGFRLLAIFHTHPFTYRTGNHRGPSLKDFKTAIENPGVFHYIRALGPVTGPYPGEWYYYGALAVPP